MIMRLLGRASRLRTEPPPSDRHVAVTESSCSSIAPSPLSGPVWSQLFRVTLMVPWKQVPLDACVHLITVYWACTWARFR